MTVRDLIFALSEYNLNAEVYIITDGAKQDFNIGCVMKGTDCIHECQEVHLNIRRS